MARTPEALTSSELAFLEERHLGSLTTTRRDGTPHVVAIAFTYDAEAGLVRIITRDGSQKVRNVETTGHAVVFQVDGRRWLSLAGPATITRDPGRIATAVGAYEARFRPASDSPTRVAIEIQVTSILGSA